MNMNKKEATKISKKVIAYAAKKDMLEYLSSIRDNKNLFTNKILNLEDELSAKSNSIFK